MKQLSNYGIVLLFGALLLSPLSIWAQEQVSGTVTDENGAPLPGTTVVVEETNQGTTTDFDGNYQINAAQGQTIVFSYVGYESQSMAVGTSSSINMQERYLETYEGPGNPFFDRRRTDDLGKKQFVDFPVPARNLNAWGAPLYTTGGK